MHSFNACKYNKAFSALYEQIVAKGKSKKLALIAVCNKPLKQAFAIAKTGLIYDGEYKSTLVKINEILLVFLPQYFVVLSFYFQNYHSFFKCLFLRFSEYSINEPSKNCLFGLFNNAQKPGDSNIPSANNFLDYQFFLLNILFSFCKNRFSTCRISAANK
jgi:hypothetical protein